MDDISGLMASFFLLGLMIMLVIFIGMAAVPVGIAASIGIVVYKRQYGDNAKERDQKAKTNEMYQKALELTSGDKDAYLDAVWTVLEDYRLTELADALWDMEGFQRPSKPPLIANSVEGGRYRDQLLKFMEANSDPQRVDGFIEALQAVIDPLRTTNTQGIFRAERIRTAREIEDMCLSFFDHEPYFKKLCDVLDTNFRNAECRPSEYKGKNLAWEFLKHTPLLEIERHILGVEWNNRAAHTLILAGSGAGKTTLFKHMIAKLLEQDCCIIVMDSQSQLIEELARIDLPEDDLSWLSPAHNLALNPFDADPDELGDETTINNKISLLEFVIENLIDAPMTPRQKNLFYYCIQLVLSIPGGNIATFKAVLIDPTDFVDAIDKLDETAQNFFHNEVMATPEKGKKQASYDGTRNELSYRLEGLIKQPTFRRIFQSTENTFNVYKEMQDRRLILLDTSQALLAEQSATLGRFYIAQTLQACFERVKQKAIDRPVYFFIDEAHEVFDEKLERMLLQARKSNVGMVLATQDFSRATKAGIADTLLGSTATKIISKAIPSDARKLAPMMKIPPEFITDLSKYAFAFSSGDQKTVTVSVDTDPLSNLDQRADLEELKAEMEIRFGSMDDILSDEPDEPVGKYGPNDELKPQPKPKPYPRDTMSENEDHDIRPSDTL